MNTPNLIEEIQLLFKGFLIQVANYGLDEGDGKIHNIVKRIIDYTRCSSISSQLSDWKIEPPLDNLITIFLDSKSTVCFSSGTVWDIAYFLRGLHGVDFPNILYVEPIFTTSTNSLMRNQVGKQSESIEFLSLPCELRTKLEQDSYFILDAMKVQEAWKKFFPDTEKLPGHGVIIGHPDTGYQLHPEILPNLLLDKGRDFTGNGDDKPLDESNHNWLKVLQANLGHGTSTASVIISPEGKQSTDKNIAGVTGVAYGAKLIPLRIFPSVVLQEMLEPSLPKAINYAIEQGGAHIISISMGGLPSFGMRKAIINAQKKGVIVIASAGNRFPFVVWPAAYDSVIAVASSNIDSNGIAEHSCRGSRVDVAAPGEYVLCATVSEVNGKLVNGTTLGSGTSFAAALVAGVAALWLSHWGREYLEGIYGLERIPLVFDKLLCQTCKPPNGWDNKIGGKGIVDAYELLSAKLPDPSDPMIQVPLAFRQVDHVKLDRGGIETFEQLFDEVMSNPEFSTLLLTRFLSKLFNKEDKEDKELRQYLRTFGQELTFHFGTNSNLFNLLSTELQTNSSKNPEQGSLNNVLKELQNCASDYLKSYLLNSSTQIRDRD